MANPAAMATDMRSFDSDAWTTGLGFLEPYSIVVEDVHVKWRVNHEEPDKLVRPDAWWNVSLWSEKFFVSKSWWTLMFS